MKSTPLRKTYFGLELEMLPFLRTRNEKMAKTQEYVSQSIKQTIGTVSVNHHIA